MTANSEWDDLFSTVPSRKKPAPAAGADFDSMFADAPVSQQVQTRSAFDELPWYSKLGQAADDTVRLVADGASFGYGDKLSAYMNSIGGTDEDYEKGLADERARTQAARDRAGSAGTAAEVGGMILPGALLPAATLPARFGAVSKLGASAAVGMGEGAGMGTLSALGHDTDVDEGARSGALWGLGGGIAAPAITGALGKAAGYFDKITPRRSIDELRQAKTDAYDAADNLGAAYNVNSVGRTFNQAKTEALSKQLDPDLNPRATRAFNKLEDRVTTRSDPVSLSELDTIRQFNKRNLGADPGEDFFGNMLNRHLDDFQASAGPSDMVAGNPAAANKAITDARAANSRYAKTQTVEDALYKGENAASNTEGRAQLRSVLNSEDAMRGFSAEERAALEEVVRGTQGTRAADAIGRVLPKSFVGGSIAGGILGTIAGPLGGIAGAAIPAVGWGMRALSNRGTRNSVNKLLDTIDGQAGRVKNPVRRGIEGQEDNVRRAVPGLSLSDPLSRSREELRKRRQGR